MNDNQLLEDLMSSYGRDYLNMVNEQGVISGKNNWEVVFRTFALGKLAELELRIQKLELSNNVS